MSEAWMYTTQRYTDGYSVIDQKVKNVADPICVLTNGSWRVDETYVKVKGVWKYLYRAVDSNGNTLDFLLIAKRNDKAAKRFFLKALKACYNQEPRVITVDKNAAYPKAINELIVKKELHENVELRQQKYLNNIIE